MKCIRNSIGRQEDEETRNFFVLIKYEICNSKIIIQLRSYCHSSFIDRTIGASIKIQIFAVPLVPLDIKWIKTNILCVNLKENFLFVLVTCLFQLLYFSGQPCNCTEEYLLTNTWQCVIFQLKTKLHSLTISRTTLLWITHHSSLLYTPSYTKLHTGECAPKSLKMATQNIVFHCHFDKNWVASLCTDSKKLSQKMVWNGEFQFMILT